MPTIIKLAIINQ